MAEVIGFDIERWLQDHDTDLVDEDPPVQNTWYEVFHAEDVRLLVCVINQSNDETLAKDIEVRWTIDTNVYLVSASVVHGGEEWVYRGHLASAVGTSGLLSVDTPRNAALYADKRGLDFKVEVRMTSALGTNQRLRCYCVRETQEIT